MAKDVSFDVPSLVLNCPWTRAGILPWRQYVIVIVLRPYSVSGKLEKAAVTQVTRMIKFTFFYVRAQRLLKGLTIPR